MCGRATLTMVASDNLSSENIALTRENVVRVIIAARLSQERGKTQTGIDSQDEDAREWAEEKGHEVVETVRDKQSGTLAMWQRPNLRPWVTQPDLMARYDGIVAAKQDRLSRAKWRDETDIRR